MLRTAFTESDERLERLQMLLMVREPATGLAADAYERASPPSRRQCG